MISYAEALAILCDAAHPTESESVSLCAALGRVAAQDVAATFDIPSFETSAMDGYALRGDDAKNASSSTLVTLPVTRTMAAGGSSTTLRASEAIAIMTGAPVPSGADTVVMLEDVTVGNGTILLTKPPVRHANIRFPGEDFRKGDVAITKGMRLGPHHVMALGALGCSAVAVHKKPRLTFFATGSEILESGDMPKDGHIYNANAPYLMAAATEAGLPARYLGVIPDDPAQFLPALQAPWSEAESETGPEIIISTGAVSKGAFDFVPAALKTLGAKILFHGVAIKPGKPILFAVLPDGRYYLGLPGNPIATAAGFRFFVMPLVRALLGLPSEKFETARLATPFRREGPRALFLKAVLSIHKDGVCEALILPGQESFKIAPLVQANGWVFVEEQTHALEVGAHVMTAPLNPFADHGDTTLSLDEESHACRKTCC